MDGYSQAACLALLSLLGASLCIAAVDKFNMEQDDRPFKMNKVNLIWQKAKLKLNENKPKLSALYQELKYQDQLEADLKKRRNLGDDADGEFEALARTKFLSVLSKYGLEGIHPDPPPLDQRNNEAYIKPDLQDKWEKVLQDKKLGKLWRTAQQAGFSDNELGALRAEFLHHIDKVEELNALHADMKNRNLAQNSVESLKNEESKDSLREEKEQQVHLKKRYKELRDSIGELEQRIHSEKMLDKSASGGFTHPKVIDLWFNAKKSNFTEEELISMQEELRHFEHKLNKLEHMETERDAINEKVLDKRHQLGNYPEQQLKVEEKVKDYTRKIKKHEYELRSRIDKAGRNEL